jgi:hypothetical protein
MGKPNYVKITPCGGGESLKLVKLEKADTQRIVDNLVTVSEMIKELIKCTSRNDIVLASMINKERKKKKVNKELVKFMVTVRIHNRTINKDSSNMMKLM